jgi:predicted dehydrogenase
VDSDFKTVKQVLCEGALGEIVEAEFHFDHTTQHWSPNNTKKQLMQVPEC